MARKKRINKVMNCVCCKTGILVSRKTPYRKYCNNCNNYLTQTKRNLRLEYTLALKELNEKYEHLSKLTVKEKIKDKRPYDQY